MSGALFRSKGDILAELREAREHIAALEAERDRKREIVAQLRSLLDTTHADWVRALEELKECREADASSAREQNLAMLLRRMIWFARRLDGDREIKVLAAKAAQFLNDAGLGGSVLRVEDRTELRKIADEINRIVPEPK